MAFEPLLYLALGLLILGNGFFKPNISTMVGQLYPQGDPRRDGAYTIFYMGINLGAFLSRWSAARSASEGRLALRLRRRGRRHGPRPDDVRLHAAGSWRAGFPPGRRGAPERRG